jgi:hypothetical protein
MDPRILELELRISHRHNDGTNSPMVEVTEHHDAAEHDPERQWGIRRIFRCVSCEETVTIESRPGDEGAPDSRPI